MARLLIAVKNSKIKIETVIKILPLSTKLLRATDEQPTTDGAREHRRNQPASQPVPRAGQWLTN